MRRRKRKGGLKSAPSQRHGRKKKAAALKVAAAQTMASRATSLRLGWDEFPTRVWVVLGHGRGKLALVGAEIFLEDAAMRIICDGHSERNTQYGTIGCERLRDVLLPVMSHDFNRPSHFLA